MGFKVFVFEHDGLWLDIYKAFLSGAQESLETVFADTPESAVAYLAQNDVDLLVVDMDYPSFDGFDFLDAVKKDTPHAQKPFIMATAEFRDDYFAQKAYKIGAVDYLVKTENMDKLYNRIKLVEKLKNLYAGG